MAEGGEPAKVVAKVEGGVGENAAVVAPKEEEEDQKEYTVDEMLEQHQELIDSMLAEVLLVRVLGF